MATEIRVTPEQLAATAKDVEGQVALYKRYYDELYNEVGMLKDTWQGEANINFAKQIDGFKDDFEKLETLLKRYVNFIIEASNKYSTTENQLSQDSRSLSTGY